MWAVLVDVSVHSSLPHAAHTMHTERSNERHNSRPTPIGTAICTAYEYRNDEKSGNTRIQFMFPPSYFCYFSSPICGSHRTVSRSVFLFHRALDSRHCSFLKFSLLFCVVELYFRATFFFLDGFYFFFIFSFVRRELEAILPKDSLVLQWHSRVELSNTFRTAQRKYGGKRASERWKAGCVAAQCK